MKIITPTYKRAGKVKAINVFGDNLIIACHESEKEEYKITYPDNEIINIPDSEKGNMAKVRNYILNNCNTEQLVMVDDDVIEIGYHEEGKTYQMGIDEILLFLKNGFNMARELGTILWGLNLQADPKFYRQFSPISFLSPVLGPFCCISTVNKEIQYDERLGLNEDYDMALQVMYSYHKILRFNKYYYKAGHLKESGGCGAYRTLTKEREQAKIMKTKWGDIVQYNFSKSTNPILNVPLKGI